MKPLNFIRYTPEPAHAQYRWGRLPVIISLCVLSIVIALHARQVITLLSVKQEYTTLKKFTEQQKLKIARKKTLTKEHTKLQDKLNTLTAHKIATPTALLKELARSIPDTTRIHMLDYDIPKKTVVITGQALNSEGVTSLVRALSLSTLFKTLTLTQVQKHSDHFYNTFILHAQI